VPGLWGTRLWKVAALKIGSEIAEGYCRAAACATAGPWNRDTVVTTAKDSQIGKGIAQITVETWANEPKEL